MSVSADTCGWRMAKLCCGRPGLFFAGYFLGGIFLLYFLFSNARWNALDDLSTRKYRVCEDLWTGYKLTRSPQGALPIMAKTEGSALKGYLIRTSSTWKGGDFVSWSISKGREICHFVCKRSKRANRPILLMWKETLTSWSSACFFILKRRRICFS